MIIYIILIIVILKIIFNLNKENENFCEDIEKINKNELYDVPLVSPYIVDDEYIKNIQNQFNTYKNDLKIYFKNLEE
jgi:hypothetical protein